ncbi:hypothetical protein ACWENO_36095, partial [Streptomyces sp. NPDC004436]
MLGAADLAGAEEPDGDRAAGQQPAAGALLVRTAAAETTATTTEAAAAEAAARPPGRRSGRSCAYPCSCGGPLGVLAVGQVQEDLVERGPADG